MRIALAFSLTIVLFHGLVRGQPVMEPGPKSPADSLACLKPRPGFTAQLMAAEPLVMSPIAFAWGADGKFWVVEMGDYPLGVDGKPGGKVKFLEKSKADGPYDKATVFLDNLGYPTGVTPWGKGVIVTCAPDIFYAEDTDGDGVADKKKVLFTGFKEGNPQHRVNGLVWGLDNWLYGANGDSGGAIKSIKTGALVNISGRDFRIKPDEGVIEAVSGPTQFGRARDDWGNWFGNNNSAPLYHYVLEDRYLKRNPHVLYPDVRVQVSDKPGAAQVYPISKPLPRFNNPQSVNHFTSACSAIVYRDNLFGPDFANNTFVSEPVHNLVHREIMTPKGVTFTSTRAADEQTSEFLASTDNWFRPTTIQTGPDGALWVADMYRYVIEHPEWIPKDWQKKLDLRAGHDKGRIYRVFPEGKKPLAIPRLDKLNTDELVKALDSPSGWQRDTAQRLLVARNDEKAEEPLEKVLKENTNPLARLHAMAALEGRGWARGLGAAMADKNPAVRRHAVRASEPFLRYSGGYFEMAYEGLLGDPDPNVRLQLAYTLGNWPNERAGELLGMLFASAKDDRYVIAAVVSSVDAKNWSPFFSTILKHNAFPDYAITNLMRMVTAFGTTSNKVNFLAKRIDVLGGKSKGEQFVTLANLLDDLEANKSSLSQWLESSDRKEARAGSEIKKVFRAARAVVADPKSAVGEKALAIRVLGREADQWEEDRKFLSGLLIPQVAEDIQAAVVQNLSKNTDPRIPDQLIKPWKGYSPTLRSQVQAVLISRLAWTRFFLDAMETKQILPTELDAIRRQQLLEHRDEEVRQRAAKLFSAASNPDRNRVVMQYILTVPPQGNIDLGKKIFTKNCAACHQLGGIGQQVGPDLASVPDKSREGLLTAILDPNRVVEARYVNYLATTKTGLTLSGVLFGETTTSITLVAADGKKHELLRRDLDELASTGKSPMPEGMEKEIPPRDMADLIAFLRSGIPDTKPKQFEGNLPQLVRPDAKGVLKLLPKNGAIYGKSLLLEKKHGNLGHWSSGDDHVVWTLDVPAAGTHAVELEWACADSSAGNTFILQVGEKKRVHTVAGTGTWDDYRVIWIGTIDLPQGRVEATVRSGGPIRGALIDLKGIYLVPKN